jgi:hypothetical protein
VFVCFVEIKIDLFMGKKNHLDYSVSKEGERATLHKLWIPKFD